MATIALRIVSGIAPQEQAICAHRVRAAKRPTSTRLSFESLEKRTVLSAAQAVPLSALRILQEVQQCSPVPRVCNDDTPSPSASAAGNPRSAYNAKPPCDTAPASEEKSTNGTKQRCETKPTYETKQRCETRPTNETRQRCETKPTSEPQQRCETKPTNETKQRCETKPTSEAKQRCETKPTSEAKQRCETKPTSEVKQRCETKPTYEAKQRCEAKPACEVKSASDSKLPCENGSKSGNRNVQPETREVRQSAGNVRQDIARVVDGCFGDLRFICDVARRR